MDKRQFMGDNVYAKIYLFLQNLIFTTLFDTFCCRS